MQKPNRLIRYDEFEDFFKRSKKIWGKLEAGDPRSHRFSELYSLCVVPGGRNGGINKRLIEVFFGNRPFDHVDELKIADEGPRISHKLLTEAGACLQYQCEDSGIVHCLLYPAATQNLRRKEEVILLDTIKSPGKLLHNSITKKHWRQFISYMHVTSLDGEPNLYDKISVSWLLFTRALSIDGKIVKPQWLSSLGVIVQFSLTVGLSGFILGLISLVQGPSKVFVIGEDKEIRQVSEKQIEALGSLTTEVQVLSQSAMALSKKLNAPIAVKALSDNKRTMIRTNGTAPQKMVPQK